MITDCWAGILCSAVWNAKSDEAIGGQSHAQIKYDQRNLFLMNRILLTCRRLIFTSSVHQAFFVARNVGMREPAHQCCKQDNFCAYICLQCAGSKNSVAEILQLHRPCKLKLCLKKPAKTSFPYENTNCSNRGD